MIPISSSIMRGVMTFGNCSASKPALRRIGCRNNASLHSDRRFLLLPQPHPRPLVLLRSINSTPATSSARMSAAMLRHCICRPQSRAAGSRLLRCSEVRTGADRANLVNGVRALSFRGGRRTNRNSRHGPQAAADRQPFGYICESAACASTHTLGWVVACSWPCWASTTLPDASACRLSSRISASRSLSAASIAS